MLLLNQVIQLWGRLFTVDLPLLKFLTTHTIGHLRASLYTICVHILRFLSTSKRFQSLNSSPSIPSILSCLWHSHIVHLKSFPFKWFRFIFLFIFSSSSSCLQLHINISCSFSSLLIVCLPFHRLLSVEIANLLTFSFFRSSHFGYLVRVTTTLAACQPLIFTSQPCSPFNAFLCSFGCTCACGKATVYVCARALSSLFAFCLPVFFPSHSRNHSIQVV